VFLALGALRDFSYSQPILFPNSQAIILALLDPVAVLGVAIFVLGLEWLILKDNRENASIFRLVRSNNPSVRRDIFFFLLRMSGLHKALTLAMSLGAGWYINNVIQSHLGWSLLANANLVTQFIVVIIVHSFFAYWSHRILHSSALWNVHKLHHTAESMNAITALRTHPFSYFFADIFSAAPLAILGADIFVILIYIIFFDAIWNYIIHSQIDWRLGWLGKHVLVTPGYHAIHHSIDPEHYNSNYSVTLIFWDRLFGTQYKGQIPPISEIKIGVEDGHKHNEGLVLSMLFNVWYLWCHETVKWFSNLPQRCLKLCNQLGSKF